MVNQQLCCCVCELAAECSAVCGNCSLPVQTILYLKSIDVKTLVMADSLNYFGIIFVNTRSIFYRTTAFDVCLS